MDWSTFSFEVKRLGRYINVRSAAYPNWVPCSEPLAPLNEADAIAKYKAIVEHHLAVDAAVSELRPIAGNHQIEVDYLYAADGLVSEDGEYAIVWLPRKRFPNVVKVVRS